MNKISILLAVVFMLLTACNTPEAELPSTTVVQHNTIFTTNPLFLNGKVKSVEYRTYWPVENNELIEKGELMTIEERDSIGFSYDFIAYFNEVGLIDRVETVDGDKVLSYWDTEYEGKIIYTDKQYRNDTIRSVHKYIYDDNLQLKEVENYGSDINTLINRYEINTNDDGFMTEIKVITVNDEFFGRYTFNLDENNRYIEQKNYNSSDSLIYHKKGIYNDKGFAESWEILVSYNSAGDKFKHEYTDYDEKGNWTKMNYYNNGELKSVEVLIIKYYDN